MKRKMPRDAGADDVTGCSSGSLSLPLSATRRALLAGLGTLSGALLDARARADTPATAPA